MNYLKPLRNTITTLAAGAFMYAGCGSAGCGSEAEQSLTDCLIEKKVKLYSAWWCIPCQQQEQMLEEELGEAWNQFKEHIVVQCYGELQVLKIQICKDKKVVALPAWEFPGGNPESVYGVQSLEEIAELAGCEY